jgi:hypothetical protein
LQSSEGNSVLKLGGGIHVHQGDTGMDNVDAS